MKVYVVKAPYGEYESYQEPIDKIFLDKQKAIQYVEEENAKLPLEQAKMIYEWEGKEITIEDILDQIQGEDK